MKFFSKFTKNNNILEKKYYNTSTSTYLTYTLADTLNGGFSSFLQYYKIVKPVQHGVDLITQSIQSIPIKLYNTKTKEWILDHPFLELLKRPNRYQDYSSWIGNLVRFYILTGNAYVNATGDINRPPLELYAFNPILISPVSDGVTGFVDYYQMSNYREENFTKLGMAENRARFTNSKGELFALKTFNPDAYSQFLHGISMLESCEEQIELYNLITRNSRSLLKNGMRPSGLLYFNSKTNPIEDLEQAEKKLQKNFNGTENAGKTMITGGDAVMQYQQLSESIKDMDFPHLLEFCERTIYECLKIPMDLVKGGSSYANQDTARYELYDNCILPIAKQVFSFLTRHILHIRFSNSENLVLKVDASEISILQNRMVENKIKLFEKHIITRNEVRTEVGYEGNTAGGDVFSRDGQLVPAGEDVDISNNRKKPTQKAMSSQMVNTLASAVENKTYTVQQVIEIIQAYQDA